MKGFAQNIDPNAAPDIEFVQDKYIERATITSQTNIPVKITGYKLMARRDLPNVTKYNQGLLYTLGQAFVTAQIGANAGTSNTALVQARHTIWQASQFLQDFKVLRTITRTLMPGETAVFHNNDTRRHLIRPNAHLNFVLVTDDYADAQLTVTYKQGETFWLWKMEDLNTGVNMGTSNAADLGGAIMLTVDREYHIKFIPNDKIAYGGDVVSGWAAPSTVREVNPISGGAENEYNTL